MVLANRTLDRLYQEHFNTVFLALHTFGDAEEKTQAAFFKLADMLHRMSPTEIITWENEIDNMTGYLTNLGKNVASTYYKRNNVLTGVEERFNQLYAPSQVSNVEDIVRGDAWVALENGLSARDFGVLVKKNVEDKTYGEVAQELGLGSSKNARLVHFRARNKAKALLAAS